MPGPYWWHRNANEPNLYVANSYLQGIGDFYADDFGASFNSTTRSEIVGRGKHLHRGIARRTYEVQAKTLYRYPAVKMICPADILLRVVELNKAPKSSA